MLRFQAYFTLLGLKLRFFCFFFQDQSDYTGALSIFFDVTCTTLQFSRAVLLVLIKTNTLFHLLNR